MLAGRTGETSSERNLILNHVKAAVSLSASTKRHNTSLLSCGSVRTLRRYRVSRQDAHEWVSGCGSTMGSQSVKHFDASKNYSTNFVKQTFTQNRTDTNRGGGRHRTLCVTRRSDATRNSASCERHRQQHSRRNALANNNTRRVGSSA
jgi:hypothetical protein